MLRKHPIHFVSKEIVLDIVERFVVLGLFVFFALRMLPRLVQLVQTQVTYPELILALAEVNAQALLLVVSETLSVILIIARRWSPSISSHPFDWALCFTAVTLPLLVVPVPAGTFIPASIATVLMLAGLIIQIAAKISLWRSFGILPANRGVKTGGPYWLLRHPMYAGYMITHVGFLLGFPSMQNALLYGGAFVIQIARLLREEAILNQDPNYRAYASKVRYRLIPGLF